MGKIMVSNSAPEQGGEHMPDLDEMSLVLCCHGWKTLQDWVSKLDQLADLSDEQIDSMVRLGAPRTRLVAR
jgi:hypothetical protein